MVVRSRLPLLATLATLGVACSEYTSTDGPEHCGSVGDQIWGKDLNPHDVTCDVTVTGDLTIGPDTKVRFASGSMLIVQGSLHIEGVEDRPARFEPAEDGTGWVGVWVRPWADQLDIQRPNPHSDDAPTGVVQGQVVIDHLEIVEAGLPPGVSVYERPASIVVDRGPVHMADVRIEGARQCGISVGQDGRFDAESGGIVIADSKEAAICAHAEGVSGIPEDVELPEGARIDVFGDFLTGRHTWPDRGVPYRITEDLTLAYADLTLRPGTDIEFVPDTRLQVGTTFAAPTYGDRQYRATDGPLVQARSARLHAEGSATAGVSFTVSGGSGSEGRFDRVKVTGANGGHAEAIFEHTSFSGGGSPLTSDPATLEVEDGAIVTLSNVTMDNGGGAGLRLDRGATITDTSSNLSITGHAYVASVHPDGATQLPETGSSYTGNDRATQLPRASGDIVYIDGGSFTRTGTLADLEVEYVAEGSLVVEDPDTQTNTLTIEPGVTMRFPIGSRFAAGTSDPVTLIVGDAAGEEVVFSLVDTEGENPAWIGVELGPKLLGGSGLSNTVIAGAGQDGTFGAALAVNAPELLVDGVTIDGSVHHGLLLKGTLAEGSKDLTIRNSVDSTAIVSVDSVASLPEEGADLATNAEPFVRVDGFVFTRTGTWGDLGVPYFIDNTIEVRGFVDESDDVNPARLTIGPGTTLMFGYGAGLDTGTLTNSSNSQTLPSTVEMVGTASEPVVLTASDPEVGWKGLFLFGDNLLPDQADRSRLDNVIVEHGASLFAFGAITYWNSTPTVSDITIRDSFRYAIQLSMDAFVEDPEGDRYELFDRGVYTFDNNYRSCLDDPDSCPDDRDVFDTRVFVNPRP